ncbi:MAG TPA: DUF6305 family protein [Candidatus Saccharicenans sp.]|nr:DUF6305 family protein [Candidatus Saccharicenans sp.]HPB59612.1 DUF6305 family protein [Candidatus Saccharicenans sp.]HQM74568.1 DUF6305 family protein [Candidatus Saccharicenans sp.]HQO76405.1 DUF6305 family protein [Candidatus Saccharicenans sp.]HUM79047.1 DUF6305 family protein [Candidatus Saccharicenans sp.]
MKKISVLMALSLILLVPASFLLAQSKPLAQPPVLLTSCGQSPGPAMIKVFLQKLNIEFELNPLATAANLQQKKAASQPYGSVIIVMGASLKGMGAAGISIDDEIKRITQLIEEAKKEGITVIGAHIEGMKRRSQGASAGDTTDEQSIDAVAPNCHLLLINKDGNSDGRFTAIAKAKNIPMIEIEKNVDLMTELARIYGR